MKAYYKRWLYAYSGRSTVSVNGSRRWGVSFFLFVILGVCITNPVFSQEITLNIKNQKLIQVIKEVRKQSKGYDFVFNAQMLDKALPVTVDIESLPLKEALDIIFRNQPLQYEIKNKTILIREKDQATRPTNNKDVNIQSESLRGRVVDESGQPIPGTSVRVSGEDYVVIVDKEGYFEIPKEYKDLPLQVFFIGYQRLNLEKYSGSDIVLMPDHSTLEEIDVYTNTGYQSIPKERAVGSFEVVDNTLLNRSTSSNILDRLNGLVPGLQFQTNDLRGERIETNPNLRRSPITIRGESTFYSSTNPLIVVDNFPFEGDISSINPNDVESITVLKDASAASIWGAKSGNGVIVITTKSGKKNEKMKIDFFSNLTLEEKPDLYYDKRFLDSRSFIEVEQFLFDKGYFNSDLNNTSTRPVVSPSVQIMDLMRSEIISKEEGEARLDILRNQDIRDDISRYVYQNATRQQHSLALRGGTDNLTYRVSAGFDKNRDQLVRNSSQRFTLNAVNTYTPIRNLEISTGLNYTQSHRDLNNDFNSYSVAGAKYSGILFPYNKLSEDGKPTDILYQLSEKYLVEAEEKGFRDWRFRPLDEIELADNTGKINSILARISTSYQILPGLTGSLYYQIEQQKITERMYRSPESYYVRDLYNRFSIFDNQTQELTHNYPDGGYLTTTNTDWKSSNFRIQLDYDKKIGSHGIYALIGYEARELKTEGSTLNLLGYDDQFGTSVMTLDYTKLYPTSPSGSSRIPSPGNNIVGYLNRFLSYYANASYVYENRYTLTASARKDGANLFGVETNNKFSPLWSIGLGWEINKESFYNSNLIPYLRLRASFGYNGNTYQNGTGLLTGRYFTNYYGFQYLSGLTAPNNNLSWERIKNFNLGLDFETKNNRINGSIEYYNKSGIDLIQPTDLPPQTGFTTYFANTAETNTKGLDLRLEVKIIQQDINWSTVLIYSKLKDKIVKFDQPYTSISNMGGKVGKPLKSIYAYKWAGINPENGNPQGWQNGVPSEDYNALYNDLGDDNISYMGSFIPNSFGSLRNDFSYKDFSVSFNITYFFDFVFRRPATSLNYIDQLKSIGSNDYTSHWKKIGDELDGAIPSLVYPGNNNRNNFYQYSEKLIESGDHIRLRDIRLGYDLKEVIKNERIRVSVFGYLQNVAILWRKNSHGIDPQMISGGYPIPRFYSFGINLNI